MAIRVTLRMAVWVSFCFNRGLMMSFEIIVPVVRRHVSAEEMTAARSAASTNPFNPTGSTAIRRAGKACSLEISGMRTFANMPIPGMRKARGIRMTAVVRIDFFAVFERFEVTGWLRHLVV